jgi:perosamine synthetase
MLLTTSKDLYERARRFRTHGITTDHAQRAEIGTFHYDMVDLGYNYRLSDVHCALGISQLSKLHQWISRRIAIAVAYDAAFEGHSHVTPLRNAPEEDSVHHIYVIRLKLDTLTADRSTVFKALRAENIGVNVHYRPVHLHPYYVNNHGTAPGMCPKGEAVYDEIITLPVFPAMSDQDVTDVIKAVTKVTNAYAKK